MTSDTLLSGFLKDFNLVEVLQVMELGGMTGAINLQQEDGKSAIIYFNQGKMANCTEFDSNALTFGEVLQQLHMATHEQIEYAFSQQLQDVVGKRMGERLLAVGVLSPQQLREALRTKALWIARELALWHKGTYEFIASPSVQKLLPYGEAPLDIEVMRVTMEMVRYSDEWEALQPLLPQGMHTLLQMSPLIPRTMHFYPHTVELFMHVNRYHKVRRIACAMQMPELDVARELAQLVQQHFLLQMPQEPTLPTGGRRIRLPDPAEKLRLENFQLLDLIGRMEQAWERRRTPVERLPALVEFVNWTMDALADACRAKGTELDSNTLQTLLINENLCYMGTYEFQVEQNHIDVVDFASKCDEILHGEFQMAEQFYNTASSVLQHVLSIIFESINARVADPRERMENQEVWEEMFNQFSEQS